MTEVGAPATPAQSVERVHCNTCGRATKHVVLARREQRGDEPYDDDISVWWVAEFTLFECCGCEDVCLRRRFWFSEWDPETPQVEYFPPQVSRHAPAWADRLPRELQDLLKEVYTALQADCRRLALMGARALVDMVILQTIGDVGTFREKLEGLERDGYVSRRGRAVLEAALDAGHAAAHRGHLPSAKQLNAVIDVVEHLLQSQLLETAAAELRASTPPRRRRPAGTQGAADGPAAEA
jgi:hypothetical protein